jgi:ribulose-5-phosphate 4-epimerase/fuculose-1-phosphate aldolase
MAIASSQMGINKMERLFDEVERDTRLNLAAAFRLASHLGWNDGLGNHITARLASAPDTFLMNPRRLGWHEITASALIKLNLAGPNDREAESLVGPAGLNFHRAILHARPDMACVLHTHSKPGVIIAALQDGLEIFDQTGCMLFGDIAQHAFEGYASENAEATRIVADLGDKRAMIMWNHGLLTVGKTIGEAFLYMKRLIWACDLQRELMATGGAIRSIPKEALETIRQQMKEKRGNQPYGGQEWEMYRRMADKLDPSYAT